jgi:dihydroorotate dehydrogenase
MPRWRRLLARLTGERDALAERHGRRVPLAVKIAPDLTDDAVEAIARLLVGTGRRRRHRDEHHARARWRRGARARRRGGRPVRGAACATRSTAVVRTLARALDGALPIIGVGGILSGADARAKIDAGATLVQLYTGLIYRGPALVAECVRALASAERLAGRVRA